MTDRELLERAAKAAGKPAPLMAEQRGLSWGNGWWNPLTDDGDAFRLAVALRLTVYRLDDTVRVWDALMYGAEVCEEKLGTDPAAATRRAIVRAAAALSDYPSGW